MSITPQGPPSLPATGAIRVRYCDKPLEVAETWMNRPRGSATSQIWIEENMGGSH